MNSLLIDSHILLWSISDSPKLSKAARRLIQTTPRVYVSVLSFFELKAKQAKGKLNLPDSFLDLAEDQGFIVLDLRAKHLQNFAIYHTSNSDPFDNALLSIAEHQHFKFLTADHKILKLQKSHDWIIDGS